MFNLLIVDDEQVERQGVCYLVHDFNLDLITYEAENGKNALEFISANHVDILLTDIKMPFMDGLDLACAAKKIDSRIKVIIFSAYGEFDYARRAIENDAAYYLLKPVDPEEFFNVMSKVIKICMEERDEEKKILDLMENYNKNLSYAKEKILTDLINGIEMENDILHQYESMGIDIECENSVMLLVDFKKSFFNSKNDEFVKLLKSEISTEFEYLNLNENQSIVIFRSVNAKKDKEILKSIGEKIKRAVYDNFGMKLCLVFSDTVNSASDYSNEYKNMERMSDYGFFFDDSILLFSDENFSDRIITSDWVEKMLESIYAAFDSGDTMFAVKETEQLFNMFKLNKSDSSLFIMYYSAEIMNKAYKKLVKNCEEFKESLEKIFSKDNLEELRDFIVNTIIELGTGKQRNSDEECKKVINTVIQIIEKEYSSNIGLEYVAEKVHLAPTYLSYLFKRETGQSFLKFITQYRLKKASELILDTNMKIINICSKVGYSKLSYFCMLFKNNYGMTPSKYREERR